MGYSFPKIEKKWLKGFKYFLIQFRVLLDQSLFKLLYNNSKFIIGRMVKFCKHTQMKILVILTTLTREVKIPSIRV